MQIQKRIKGMVRGIAATMLILLGVTAGAAAEKRVGEGVVLHPVRTSVPPRIDGVLDDAVWQGKPLIAEPFIVNNLIII